MAALMASRVRSTLLQRASLVAALILLTRELLPTWNGWPDSVAKILALVGAGKSQTYAMLERLRALLPTLLGVAGRPSPPAAEAPRLRVVDALCDFLIAHPGAIGGTEKRRTYSDSFRRFVVKQVDPEQSAHGMSLVDLASAVRVPVGTLKVWIYPGDNEPDAPAATVPSDDDENVIRNTHLRQIATLWDSWNGTFLAFCNMVRTDHRLLYSASFIGNFLEGIGKRHRRRQMPVEAPWSSNTFRRLFPGAQWLGDGTSIAIRWAGEVFCFNVESIDDVATAADMGFAVCDAEDEEALRMAYYAALETTCGVPPVALSLDNRPSNHSPGAKAATPGTILLPSTPGRGQAKAPLEGSYGLFQQALPALVVPADSPREQARRVLELILTAWYRGRNGKPRRRLQGRSPAKAYWEARPTPEEIQQAVAWAEELQRKNELARRTREARRDPVRIELLKRGLAERGIPDPNHRLAISLSCYARDAIVRGLAVFQAKQEQGTLPSGADLGRYLGGIIRQLHIKLELERTSDHLLDQRIRLRDLTLEPLQRIADRVRVELPLSTQPQAFIDRALDAQWKIDFRFWGKAAAEALLAVPGGSREQLYRSLCRRIAASFKADRERRGDLVDWLAQVTVLP